jgi:hypothetical protein
VHAGVYSRLGERDVGEGEIKNVSSTVCRLSWHADVIHRGGSSPPSELYAAASCGNSGLEGFVSNVKVPSYNTVLRGCKVRNVLEHVRGKWLSITVQYR